MHPGGMILGATAIVIVPLGFYVRDKAALRFQ